MSDSSHWCKSVIEQVVPKVTSIVASVPPPPVPPRFMGKSLPQQLAPQVAQSAPVQYYQQATPYA